MYFLQSIEQVLPSGAKDVLLDDWGAQGAIILIIITLLFIALYNMHNRNKHSISYLESKIKEAEDKNNDILQKIISVYEKQSLENEERNNSTLKQIKEAYDLRIETAENENKRYFELATCANNTQKLLLDNLKEMKNAVSRVDEAIESINESLKSVLK